MAPLALFLYAQQIALHHFYSSALPFYFNSKDYWEFKRVFFRSYILAIMTVHATPDTLILIVVLLLPYSNIHLDKQKLPSRWRAGLTHFKSADCNQECHT